MSKILDDIKSHIRKETVFPSVTITPHLAKALLEMNTGNRPIKKAAVDNYAQQMSKDAWIFTGETISFSKSGKLLNGQHRLLAIIQSEKAQKYNIQTGVNEEAFAVYDTGKNRSAGDVLAIAGYDSPTVMGAAIKVILGYYKRVVSKSLVNTDTKRIARNNEVVGWLETGNKELLKDCVKTCQKYYTKDTRFLSPGTYAGFMYLFSLKSKDMAKLFFEKLATGEDISKTHYSPIYVLRQKYIGMQGTKMRADTSHKYALLIKAWNAFRDEKQIARINWGDDEPFPKIK